jgi:hypothetical protein
MIKPFKFLTHPLIFSHEQKHIFADEFFFSVNKEDFIYPNGKITLKYTIVERYIISKRKDKFKPDYDKLWYFKSRHAAEWYVDVWKRHDRYNEWWEKLRKKRTR